MKTPPRSDANHERDSFCLNLLATKDHREAMDWMGESAEGDIRTIGEQSPEDSLAIVKQLYQEGAKKVWAVDLEIYPDEGQSSNILILELPVQLELRKRLFDFEARVATSEGFDATTDEGQHYMFLFKFKLAFEL